jgi:hypothetical protein
MGREGLEAGLEGPPEPERGGDQLVALVALAVGAAQERASASQSARARPVRRS